MSWRPTAARETLRRRAVLLQRARDFFAARRVLEVNTPIVVNAPVSDIHIHSARVELQDADGARAGRGDHAEPAASDCSHPPRLFLHTSPEYAMKRLLAAGSGDIFQICPVVRGFERGRQHNAEFTLIEWYRQGFSLADLMAEVADLVRTLLGRPQRVEHISYREVFLEQLHIDPFTATPTELSTLAGDAGFRDTADSRDELLELLMGTVIGPRLGHEALTFVHGYPATQAALARLDPEDPRAALRFELYARGMELANGFHELLSATEQRARFVHDNEERQRAGRPVYPLDEQLLAALAAGLPDCAGVAVGFDRVVMLATGAQHIDEVLTFPTERA